MHVDSMLSILPSSDEPQPRPQPLPPVSPISLCTKKIRPGKKTRGQKSKKSENVTSERTEMFRIAKKSDFQKWAEKHNWSEEMTNI